MIVAGLPVYKATAQTWRGIAPGAQHYYGVLTNMETNKEWQSPECTTQRQALKLAIEHWFEISGPEHSRLFVNFSDTALACLGGPYE